MRSSLLLLSVFIVACSSSEGSRPYRCEGFECDEGEAGVTHDTGQGDPHDDTGQGDPVDDTGNGGGDDSFSANEGFRCYVTSGGCICLDPAPSSYTSTTCPDSPCCYRDTRGSPAACNCADFTGSQCDDWIASAGAPRVDSCP